MQPKRLIALGFALIFAAVAAAPAPAQEWGENKALALFVARPQLLSRELRLTPEQNATLRTLVTAARTGIRPIRAEIKGITEQIRAALESANPDACAIGALVVSRYEKYEDVEALLQDFDDDFSAILTPEQLAKYEDLKERINGHR